jgi:hypothetical protein
MPRDLQSHLSELRNAGHPTRWRGKYFDGLDAARGHVVSSNGALYIYTGERGIDVPAPPSSPWELILASSAGMTPAEIIAAISTVLGTDWKDVPEDFFGTDLDAIADADSVEITSSTGNSVVVPSATPTVAGVLSAADKAKLDGLSGSGETNLSIENRTDETLDVASDTGTDATIPKATTSLAGLMSAADKVRLDASGGSFFSQDTPPSSPAAGDEWLDTSSGITYTFVSDGDSSQWVELGPGGGPSTAPVFYEQSTPPSAPNPGDRWLDATSGDIYTFVDDGTSTQWVELPG